MGDREYGWHIVDAQTNLSQIKTYRSRVAWGRGSSCPKLLMLYREFVNTLIHKQKPS